MREPKQVIVVRRDLNMRRGKQIAQGAHASLKVLLDRSIIVSIPASMAKEDPRTGRLSMEVDEALLAWMEGLFVKICVSVNSEEELVQVYEAAKAKGPADPAVLDEITGHLSLL